MISPWSLPVLSKNIPTKLEYTSRYYFLVRLARGLKELGWLNESNWDGNITNSIDSALKDGLDIKFHRLTPIITYTDFLRDYDSQDIEDTYGSISIDVLERITFRLSKGYRYLDDKFPGVSNSILALLASAIEETCSATVPMERVRLVDLDPFEDEDDEIVSRICSGFSETYSQNTLFIILNLLIRRRFRIP
jgi:hypothetical protein